MDHDEMALASAAFTRWAAEQFGARLRALAEEAESFVAIAHDALGVNAAPHPAVGEELMGTLLAKAADLYLACDHYRVFVGLKDAVLALHAAAERDRDLA